jgi:hypothetical protein
MDVAADGAVTVTRTGLPYNAPRVEWRAYDSIERVPAE